MRVILQNGEVMRGNVYGEHNISMPMNPGEAVIVEVFSDSHGRLDIHNHPDASGEVIVRQNGKDLHFPGGGAGHDFSLKVENSCILMPPQVYAELIELLTEKLGDLSNRVASLEAKLSTFEA